MSGTLIKQNATAKAANLVRHDGGMITQLDDRAVTGAKPDQPAH
jgi:hypothetical protein